MEQSGNPLRSIAVRLCGALGLKSITNEAHFIFMDISPILNVHFYLTRSETEPVRRWLKKMSSTDRKIIGEDIKLVQYRWPLGTPLVKKMEADL